MNITNIKKKNKTSKNNLFFLFFLNKILLDYEIKNESGIIVYDKIKLNKYLKNVNLLDTTKTILTFKFNKSFLKTAHNLLKEYFKELLFFSWNKNLYSKNLFIIINKLIDYKFTIYNYLFNNYRYLLNNYLKLFFILKKKWV